MSYKELEVGYQGLKAASFYIGDESEGVSPSILLAQEAGLGGDTLPTTYEYVYTSANSPTRTTHPNCPLCLQKVSSIWSCECLTLFLIISHVRFFWACGLSFFFHYCL